MKKWAGLEAWGLPWAPRVVLSSDPAPWDMAGSTGEERPRQQLPRRPAGQQAGAHQMSPASVHSRFMVTLTYSQGPRGTDRRSGHSLQSPAVPRPWRFLIPPGRGGCSSCLKTQPSRLRGSRRCQQEAAAAGGSCAPERRRAPVRVLLSVGCGQAPSPAQARGAAPSLHWLRASCGSLGLRLPCKAGGAQRWLPLR